jgi:predicted outer membrane protein
MLFKLKLALCMVAVTSASYALAQEKAGKAGAPESQVGKAQPQNENPQSGQDSSRRPESNDAKNRNSDNPDRNKATDQDRNRNQRDVTTQRTERQGGANDSPIDSQLASCLLIGNQKEVTISQFAAERAKHEKVKEFARQMVKDHTQAISMLQRFAGPDASKELSSSTRVNRTETTVNRSTTTEDNNREGAKRSPDATVRTESNNQADRNAKDSDRNRSVTSVQVRSEHDAMPDKMLAIQREVAQKCIAMSKQELEQSNNFDQAYVGMQIAAHMGMIAHLETYKSYASPELGKVIQESLDTAQGHLRHAKELVMEIGHDSASSNRSSSESKKATSSDSSNRNGARGRDDATPRREGVIKKDAPKS